MTDVTQPPIIENPALAAQDGVLHGFFTRQGGVSEGLYASLNAGPGSQDAAADVTENRRRICAALGLAPGRLVTADQVHSAEVAVVTKPWTPDAAPKVDGMVTTVRGLALGVLAADCAPVLLADGRAGVVGTAHAGWRGALSGVIEATVAAMEQAGADRSRIAVAIGPCIGGASYEVGPEFPAPFHAQDPANDLFFRAAARPDHYLFDLGGYVASRLRALGLNAAPSSGLDTCAMEERFFSYRRSVLRGEPDYGRNISVIALTP